MAKTKHNGKKQAYHLPTDMTLLTIVSNIHYDQAGIVTDDSVEYLKQVFQSNGFYSTGKFNQSHTDQHNGSATAAELMEPVADFKGTKKAINAQFADERVQWTAIMDTLTHHASDIDAALDRTTNGQNIRLTRDCSTVINNNLPSSGYVRVGSFIHDCDMQAYTTVILTKKAGASAANFSIQTAYPGIAYQPETQTTNLHIDQTKKPSMEERYSYMTIHNKDNSGIIEQTSVYQRGDLMTKVNLKLRANPAAIYGTEDLNPADISDLKINDVKQNSETGRQFTITKQMPDKTYYTCTVQENNVFIKHFDKDNQQIDVLTPEHDGVDVPRQSLRINDNDIAKLQNIAPDLVRAGQSAQHYLKEELQRTKERQASRSHNKILTEQALAVV